MFIIKIQTVIIISHHYQQKNNLNIHHKNRNHHFMILLVIPHNNKIIKYHISKARYNRLIVFQNHIRSSNDIFYRSRQSRRKGIKIVWEIKKTII